MITECHCWPKTTQSSTQLHTKWKDEDFRLTLWMCVTETVLMSLYIDYVKVLFVINMNETHVIQQLPLYSQFPRCNAAV